MDSFPAESDPAVATPAEGSADYLEMLDAAVIRGNNAAATDEQKALMSERAKIIKAQSHPRPRV